MREKRSEGASRWKGVPRMILKKCRDALDH